MRTVFCVAVSLGLFAQDPAPPAVAPISKGCEAVTDALLKDYLGTLASEEFEGRCAGFPGNDKAAVYLAARMKEAGLKPVGDLDVGGERTYFQVFLFDRGRHITRNCVGLLEGSDEKLRDEIVVIGAHFDHVGRKGQHRAGQLGKALPEDDLWNGADDNGSGTTTVLGVLKAFASAGARPKRSVLFIWFSAEEWGLLGSRWYVQHPIFPLEKTVAMLNLDMTGRTDDVNIANTYGLGTAAGGVFNGIVDRATKTSKDFQLNTNEHYGGGSDHVSFADRKIPVLGFGEKGPCPDYHRVTDHPDRIEYGYMAKIAKAAASAVWEIADAEERPTWNADFRLPAPKDDGKPRLGAYLGALEADELRSLGLRGRGALVVNGVVPGSVAEKAGVKEDDVLVALDGRPFDVEDPRGTLVEILEKIERGREVDLELIRGKEPLRFKVVWPETKK